MTHTNQAPFAEYSFHRHIHNLVFDELGQAVLAEHNERFKETPIADTTGYEPNQPLSFSNVPRVLSYNQILHRLTNGRFQVASPADVVQHWNEIPEQDTTYADTDSIALFPKQGPNQDLAQRVLDILHKTRITVPLLVAGLGVKKANNEYGFTFTKSSIMTVTEAPYLTENGLTENGEVCYHPKTGSIAAAKDDEEGVPVWPPDNKSGLRRASRNGVGYLNFRLGGLLVSVADSRVQVVQVDPKGRAEK